MEAMRICRLRFRSLDGHQRRCEVGASTGVPQTGTRSTPEVIIYTPPPFYGAALVFMFLVFMTRRQGSGSAVNCDKKKKKTNDRICSQDRESTPDNTTAGVDGTTKGLFMPEKK